MSIRSALMNIAHAISKSRLAAIFRNAQQRFVRRRKTNVATPANNVYQLQEIENMGNETLDAKPSDVNPSTESNENSLQIIGTATDSAAPKTTTTKSVTKIDTPTANASETPKTGGRAQLDKWLGKPFRVVITDGRVLVGFFNCTDKDANIVLSMCAEYLEEGKDARILGNVMIPGKHIVSISVDMPPEGELAAKPSKTSACVS